VCVCVRVNDM